MKASKLVKTVLISSPLFVAGCGGCQPTYVDNTPYNDGVPVVTYAQPGLHYSTYYGGWVPIFVPIGGFHDGRSYEYHYYHDVPERDRRRYTPPSAATAASSAGVRQGGTTTTGKTSGASAAPTSTTKRGIAGSTAINGTTSS